MFWSQITPSSVSLVNNYVYILSPVTLTHEWEHLTVAGSGTCKSRLVMCRCVRVSLSDNNCSHPGLRGQPQTLPTLVAHRHTNCQLSWFTSFLVLLSDVYVDLFFTLFINPAGISRYIDNIGYLSLLPVGRAPNWFVLIWLQGRKIFYRFLSFGIWLFLTANVNIQPSHCMVKYLPI